SASRAHVAYTARFRSYLTVASDAVKRPRAGTATLALRLRAASASTLARTGSLTVRLGLVVTPKRAAPYAITRRITLVRAGALRRSEEHTSELQSRENL